MRAVSRALSPTSTRNATSKVLHPNVIYLKGQTDRGMAEIALQYNSSYNELV